MGLKPKEERCNPVKKSAPVTMDHVLLASQETKEERDKRIRSLFDFFDKEKFGYLEFAHIEAGLSALEIPSEYKYATDLLNACDANKDGRVDFVEFKKYMDDKELELYRIFQAIDVAHNGSILPEELWEALVRAGMSCFFLCYLRRYTIHCCCLSCLIVLLSCDFDLYLCFLVC